MFDECRKERFIREILHRLSRQRVALILQPGNVWVIEKAVSEGEGEEVVAALRTCNIRGWVEILSNAVPRGKLSPNGRVPEELAGVAPVYKLTEAGWNVIHRSHEWVVVTCFFAAATLIATLIVVLITKGLIK